PSTYRVSQCLLIYLLYFFFSSRRRHTRLVSDWSSDVCSSDLNARYIANAVPVPVIADADNGYGNAINVMRTVREYIGTGVAGIHIEDQVIPKRCGHVAGRRVIPLEEAVGKYRAADAVRRELDPDFVLIARTDARGASGGSLDEAIRRANAYLAAGADLAFVEGPTSVEEVRRVCREVKGPVFYNQTGVSPRF